MTITVAPTSGAPSASVTIPFTAVFWANATTLNAERPTASSSLVNGCSSFFIGVRLNGKCLSWISFVRFLAMVRLVQARLCPFGLAKTSNFFRPFSRLGNSEQARCTRLNEMVRFQQSFSLHGKARASAALPIWLSENVGLSFEQVGREAIRPGCPTLGSEIHAVVHSSGFVFLKVLGLVVYGRFSASA